MNKDRFTELVFLKLLYSIDGIGPQKIFSLLSKFGNPEKVINASYASLCEVEGINKILAGKIYSANTILQQTSESLEKELTKLSQIGSRIISYWDKEYPSQLKNIYFPPIILYCKGDFDQSHHDSIAIVGTREPSSYGKLCADKFSSAFAEKGIVTISGLARGIDSIVHASTLKQKGKTIAVIGSGLDIIYPPENKKLFNEIAATGIIFSEYELGTKPDAQNFPRRNRIISGLSLGTLIIETRLNGGAMQTAAYALDQGREVFAIPGQINSKQSEGPNSLIQKGEAKLVTHVEDVLDELQLKNRSKEKKSDQQLEVNLTLFEEKLFNVLSDEPKQIDEIAILSSMNTSDCLVHLLTLEFKGLVRQLPGKMFTKS